MKKQAVASHQGWTCLQVVVCGKTQHVIGLLTGSVARGTALLVVRGSSIANVLRHGAGQIAQMADDQERRTTGE